MKLSFSGICGSKLKPDKKKERGNMQQNARPAQQYGPFKAEQFGPELERQRARQEAADDRDFAILQNQIAKLKKRNNR